MNYAKVLHFLDRFLRERQYRYAVAGAFALHAYGLTRATADLDFVVEREAQAHLIPFLESLGYETLHRSAGYSNHVHPLGTLGRIDFVYVGGATAEELFAAAQPLLRLHGRQYPVPGPEHLAAMKVFAMKNAPERSLRELADIQSLLGLPGVERDRIRRYFERHGLLEKWDELEKSI